MKKLLIFALAVLMIITCCACNNNDEPPVETITLTPAEHHAASYRINEWRVEGTKDYYTVLATYSGDFYGTINEEDILYFTDTYKPFKEVFPESDIVIYNVNTTNTGLGAYIKIHTNQLIDLKKVYIIAEGTVTHIEGIETKDDFVAAGNDAKDWIKFYTTISSKAVPYNDIAELNATQNIAIITGADARAYCDATNYEVIQEENKIIIKFPYDMFTATDEEAIKNMLVTNFQVAMEKDGVVTQINPPEDIEIISDMDEDYFYVGVQLSEDKNLSEYDFTHLINISSPNMYFKLTVD